MATIKGVWVFNNAIKDKITGLDQDAVLDVLFTSNGTQFSSMCYLVEFFGDMEFCYIYYNGVDSADNATAVQGTIGDITDWINEAYKTVDFGTTEQTVPDTFLAWMQENATQQASEGTTPTAEGVKSKLQSLITASNAKTGKNDTTLTDAVKTLLEGYGQGGGGESGGGINIVDELPEGGVEGEYYGLMTFTDLYFKDPNEGGFMLDQLPAGIKPYFKKAPTLNFDEELNKATNGGYALAAFYLTEYGDAPNIYTLGGYDFEVLDDTPFCGEITDIRNATQEGKYAYMSPVVYQYINGAYKLSIPRE